MLCHQDLRIAGNHREAVPALALAASQASGEWRRCADLEEKMLVQFRVRRQYCFANDSLPIPSLVWLQDLSPEESAWRVGHVGPIDPAVREMDVAACNAAVQSFHHWAVPILDSMGARVTLSEDYQLPEDWMDHDVAHQLDLAVSMGYPTHPADCERWNEFMIRAHETRASMSPGQLREWLIEDREWGAEQANDLALRYENGMELLRAYDRVRC